MESFPAEPRRIHPTLADDPALGLTLRAKMEILFAVMLGLFLGALDQTIVGPALPTIVTQLVGNDFYVWAVTIYLLTSTISVPFWGKLSDLYGRKPIFMIGIVIFLVGSALSGLSQNMGQLILFRGIQGIGAGSLFPVALAVIGDLFTPAERGKYQGLFGAVFGIAFVAGPLIGGFLTENVSWHWIFYVNIPIGIVALFFIRRLLPTVKNPRGDPELRHPRRRDLHDRDGVPADRPDEQGQTIRTHQLYEWTADRRRLHPHRARRHARCSSVAEARAKEPIVPLDLFRNRTYAASMVSTFFAAFAFFGAIIFLPRWFQVVQGFTPDELRPGGAAARGRPHRQLDRLGPDRRRGPAATSGCSSARSPYGRRDAADDPAHRGHAGARSCGSGCSSPASASVRRSRSSRSSSRTRCRSASSASRRRT